MFAVEIESVAPLGFVLLAEEPGRERAEIIAIRPEVIVDHIEGYRDAVLMGCVDERSHVVRLAVEPGGREEIDAVIAPPEAAGEIGDRHELDESDPGRS